MRWRPWCIGYQLNNPDLGEILGELGENQKSKTTFGTRHRNDVAYQHA